MTDAMERKYWNCAGCGRGVLGESSLDWWATLEEEEQERQPIVCGRLDGRPYCTACVDSPIPTATKTYRVFEKE